MIAAKNTKPPNAPRAIIAGVLNLAPRVSLLSPSTDRGTLTLGTWSLLMLLLGPIAGFSWGWDATIIWGMCTLPLLLASDGDVDGRLVILFVVFGSTHVLGGSAFCVVVEGGWVVYVGRVGRVSIRVDTGRVDCRKVVVS